MCLELDDVVKQIELVDAKDDDAITESDKLLRALGTAWIVARVVAWNGRDLETVTRHWVGSRLPGTIDRVGDRWLGCFGSGENDPECLCKTEKEAQEWVEEKSRAKGMEVVSEKRMKEVRRMFGFVSSGV